MVGSSPDITEQKEAEATLRAAVGLREEFLSIASHELRTPLTTLQLQIDGMRRMFERGALAGAERLRRKIEVAARQGAACEPDRWAPQRLSLTDGRLRLEVDDVHDEAAAAAFRSTGRRLNESGIPGSNRRHSAREASRAA